MSHKQVLGQLVLHDRQRETHLPGVYQWNHREQNKREAKHAEEKAGTVQRSIYQNARSVATLAANTGSQLGLVGSMLVLLPVLNGLVLLNGRLAPFSEGSYARTCRTQLLF